MNYLKKQQEIKEVLFRNKEIEKKLMIIMKNKD